MGRIGGDVQHPEHLPVWPEQRAGAAAEKAVLGEEVLIAEHLHLALLGQRGADGVGALARLPQRAPLRKKMRSAWRAKPSSPLAARMAPSPSHSSNRQGRPASNWPNSGNTKRWKLAISTLCCS